MKIINHFSALDRPVIHQMTNDISIPEGKGFRIEVIFSGSPTPEVAWFRCQDRVIPSSVYKVSMTAIVNNSININKVINYLLPQIIEDKKYCDTGTKIWQS